MPVTIHWVGDVCSLDIGAESFTLPRDEQRIATHLRASGLQARDFHLVNSTVNVPYKCIGHIVYSLQKGGARRIGFIAEPPPE